MIYSSIYILMFINWINNFFSSLIFIASLSRKICEASFKSFLRNCEPTLKLDRQILDNAGLKWIYPTGLSTILNQIRDSFLNWNKPLSRDWFGAMPCYALCSFLDTNDLRRWPEIWKGWDHGITNSFFNPPLQHACYRGTQDGSLNQHYRRTDLFRKMMNNPDIHKLDLTIPYWIKKRFCKPAWILSWPRGERLSSTWAVQPCSRENDDNPFELEMRFLR